MPHLSWSEVRDRSIRFSRDWTGATSERADKQTFWNEFFDVFGIRRASVAAFEANVRNLHGHTNAIDLLWRGKLLVEHKSLGQNLDAAETQALGYLEDLAREGRHDEIPRFVLVSDFAHFTLFDLEPEESFVADDVRRRTSDDAPESASLPRRLPAGAGATLFAGRPSARISFTLGELPRVIRSFAFMLGQTRVRLDPEDPANEKAYRRMCELHDAFKVGGFTGHELERLLVRITFCVFAEDTGIFEPEAFTRFLRTQTRADGSDLGARLNELFDWLNNPQAETALADPDPLHGFRYVNGGLFRERLGFPRCTQAMRDSLLFCCDFSWARISPAVFGSLFQGVIDDRTRRQQGAHYTSERDIMKVLRSLFLDELRAEFEQLKRDRSTRRRANLEAFQQKLRSLRFLDPACGCGNFLVLAYRELRVLEIEVLKEIHGGEQQVLNVRDLCKVDVDQFYGLEYSEWPARIAEVALWLMDHQMNAQAAEAFGQSFDRLPLRTSPHIVHGNALRMDWNEVLPRGQCSYVLGNPPFIGHTFQTAEQKDDQDLVMAAIQGNGVLDYVCNWYVRAAQYIQGTHVRVAFVSTNSITQGEQAGLLWNHLFQRYEIKIHFGHRTFAWASESRGKAHVHVVIVGFAAFDVTEKRIYDYEPTDGEPTVTAVSNISPYLVAGPDRAVTNRSTPLGDVPKMSWGNKPTDGGHFLLSPEERQELIAAEPEAAQFIRPYMGGQDFLNDQERYCLWLKDAAPGTLRRLPRVIARIEAVRTFRLTSRAPTTRAFAQQPTLFRQIAQPDDDYLAVPEVSSENRRFIPIAYISREVICANTVQFIAGATQFHFGVLTSTMHMTWMRAICGRLESRYRYSNTLVYNNFPWPNPTPEQRARVEEKAASVLAARAEYLAPVGDDVRSLHLKSTAPETSASQSLVTSTPPKTATLADLYDPNTMPRDLLRAHTELDRAVEKCYRPEPFHSDRERVEHLFRLYEQLTAPLLPVTPKSRVRRSQTAASTPRPASKQRTPGLPSRPSPEP